MSIKKEIIDVVAVTSPQTGGGASVSVKFNDNTSETLDIFFIRRSHAHF